jgi:ubiquinone/menaquinone biosynthesis C-methylase UbiE
MLGGLEFVHEDETRWSREFLTTLKHKRLIKTDSCLDVAAGIGRVSSFVLKYLFDNVDMVE